MFSWTTESTVETIASAEQIWALWSDPKTWSRWDDGVEWVEPHGPFTAGTTGIMKPKDGPKVRYEMLSVTVGRGFTDRSRLPLTTLEFEHVYVPATAGRRAAITHRVAMRGLLTPLFSRVIGRSIASGLPDAMRKLVTLAERSA